jgi:DNA repair protein RAD7
MRIPTVVKRRRTWRAGARAAARCMRQRRHSLPLHTHSHAHHAPYVSADACRRAAHFAHFAGDDGGGGGAGDAVMVGGGEARRLGPWSSAYELSDAREGAAAAREERLRAAAISPAGAKPAAPRWAPREGGGARARHVPPLFSLCLDLLVEHVDEIDSLWGLPDAIRGRLAAAVCAKRRLSPSVAALFADGGAAEVLLPSCTQLEAPAMVALLAAVATPRLERLELGACGRGLGDDAAAAAARRGPLGALEVRRRFACCC